MKKAPMIALLIVSYATLILCYQAKAWNHGDCKAESHPHCIETIA